MTHSGTRISIIIPTYNAANVIDSCLKSIIKQNYKNFEVWFIDANSTDDTLSLIKSYITDYPFIKLISEPDNGIYDAMNKGIKLCTGDWIYFLGSDDTLYDKNVLSLIANKIKNCNAKIIYGNVLMQGKNQWNLDNVVFNGEYNLEKVISVNICHQAIFYNKCIFQLYGNFNLKYIVGADQDLNLRCYANTEFMYINLIIANFFVGGHSTKVQDYNFENDRGVLFYKYFKKRIFDVSFLNSRLYIRRAALSSNSSLNLWEKLFCLVAYIKLKIHSSLIQG